MKNLTLEQLIRATELCGAGAPGSCPECPCFDPSGDFECIEYLMSQAAAALKEYSCNGGGGVMTKSILLSVRPRYCELIASGKKKSRTSKERTKNQDTV